MEGVVSIGSVKTILKNPFNFMLCLFPFFIMSAFLLDSPHAIFNGLIKIIASPDILISDYIHIGGLGAAIINSAFLGTASILLLKAFQCESKGTNIMAVWLMMGFAFFGKNIFNTIPIVVGGYLYSVYQQKPFANYLAVSLLATTLSPAVSQMSFLGLNSVIGILLGIFLGIFLGFVIIPISSYTYRAHGGYNLYNVGFSAGIISIFLTAIFRNAGFEIEPVSLWSEGNNLILAAFLMTISLVLILAGVALSGEKKKSSLKDYKENYAVNDAYIKHGERAYINMGTLGIFATMLVILSGGQLSGPIIGGIFTIIGFSCVGKSLFNIAPSMIGCALAAMSHSWAVNSPSVLLTMLFSATLAPISSRFGPFWGIAAGFLHLNLTVKLSEVNGGLSLYNNGLAGGFVAMVLVPVIFSIRKDHANTHLNYDSHA